MSLLLGIIASSRGNIVPPLDTFGGAAAAYSTRLLSSAYGGSAVRVRRSFDNTEQDIGFSGGAIDETTLMNFVGYQNLLLQSETFTTANWIKNSSTVTANAGTDPFGGNNATRWVGSGTHYLGQSVSLINGQSYTISFYVKSNTGSNQLFRLLACDTIATADLTATTDWQRFTFSFVANTSLVHGVLRPSSNAASDLLVYGGQINVGITAQPYQVTTSAARSGDGFVTKWYTQDSNGENLLLQSETFENVAWTNLAGFGSLATVTPNSTTAPNSTLTADTIAASGPASRIGQSYTKTAGSFYTISAYIKKTSTSTVSLYLDLNGILSDMNLKWGASVGYPQVTYNFDTDAISSSCAFFGRQILPNGWVRLYVGTTCLNVGQPSVASFQLSSSESFFLWGAQLSQSSWLQGYQATTTAQVFRRDASQSTAANQPRIVGGGVIERENGKVSMFFDGVNDFFTGTDIALPVWSIFSTVVNKIPSATTSSIYNRGTLLAASSSRDVLLYLNGSDKRVDAQRSDSATYPTSFSYTSLSNYLVASGIYTGSQITAFADSIAGASVATTVTGSSNPVTLIGATAETATTKFFMGGEIGEVIVYDSNRTSTRADIERNIGAYYQTQWTGASAGLLDQFGGAAAAYSLRNLSSSYRGPLIRVRRSSDNAETDIGGTYSGDLDVASLVSFTGGQNLLTRSEDFADAIWTKLNTAVTANATISPDGTLTADKYTETAVNGFHALYQDYSAPSIGPMTLSFYAKAAERRYIGVAFYSTLSPYSTVNTVFDIVNGSVSSSTITASGVLISSSIQPVGNGWFRCSVTGNINSSGATRFQIGLWNSEITTQYLGVAGSGVYIWGAQLNTGILQPYIPTTTTAINGANGFVTKWYTQDANYQNLFLYSEQFENAYWTKTANGSAVSSNSIIAPDGTLTAETLSEIATTGDHYVGMTSGLTLTNAPYTFSCYYKANQRTWAAMSMYNGTNALFAFFDLQNGVLGNVDAGATASIQSVGNGWFRCSITRTMSTATTNFIGIGIAPSNGVNSYLGVVGSGVYIWGAQLNEGTLVPYTATTTTVSQRRDAIQATAASQPRIVNNGGVESEGNKPALFWTENTGMRLTASFQPIPSPQSFFAVNRIGATSGIPAAVLFDSYDNVQNVYLFTGNQETPNNVFRYSGGTTVDGSLNQIPVQYLTNIIHDTVTNVYDNNLLTITGNAGTNSLSGLSIGNVRGNPTILASGYDWFGDIQEFLVYPSNLATRLAVNSNINSYYQIYWQGNGTALLDNFSGASAAYSLRNLSSAYTGPLIRVRRSSDNVERDIYGTFGGDLDIASLVAFVGANSGFVTTWYDQSGNARHAVQGTAANQPRIVNAGVVDTENGKPTLFFDGSNDFFTMPNVNVNNLDWSAFHVARNNSSITRGFEIGSNQGPYFGRANDGNTYIQYVGTTNYYYSTSDTSTTFNLRSGFARAASANFYLNGSNVTLAAPIPFFSTDSNFSLIGRYTTGTPSNAEASELILYIGDRSSSRTAIESNINNYYKIY